MYMGFSRVSDGRVILFTTKNGLDFPVLWWDDLDTFVKFNEAGKEIISQCRTTVPFIYEKAFEDGGQNESAN